MIGNLLWKTCVPRDMAETVTRWARSEVGRVDLGDGRRSRRLLQMVTLAAKRPSGEVAAVFDRAADREGAYDFLENPLVKPEALAESVFMATAERAGDENYVYVSIDGSSLTRGPLDPISRT